MANDQTVLQALLERRSKPLDEDAAIVPMAPAGSVQLAATDALEEGVHFRQGWLSIEDLAWRLLAVNLSDLAAMGAEPTGYLLALGWPEDWPAHDATRLGEALEEAERHWGCPLLGGDTDVRPGPARLEATVFGHARRPVLRSTARPGDRLFVTGALGGAAAIVDRLLAGNVDPLAGLAIDSRPAWSDALERYRRPVPRLDASAAVRDRATALIDLSDGLLADGARLARSSGLAGRIELARIPIHPAVPVARVRELALAGGEDYELLVAGPASLADVPGLVRIGILQDGPPGHVVVE